MKIMDPIKIIAMSVCFFVLCNRHWFNGPPPYGSVTLKINNQHTL